MEPKSVNIEAQREIFFLSIPPSILFSGKNMKTCVIIKISKENFPN